MLMSAGEVQIKTVTADNEVLGDIQYGDKVAFQWVVNPKKKSILAR